MKSKFLIYILLFSIIFIHADTVVQATDTKTEAEIQAEQVLQEAYNMPIASNALPNWPQGPGVYAESAIVMDMDSGAILYAKNIDDKHYPASITKVLTSLVALENGGLDDKVNFTDDSVSFLEYGDAHIGMKPGEELTLRDALYAVLLASANEVSHAVAESVPTESGEGYDGFIQAMNDKAAELGAVNSHFVNANGLHDDNHYTTARDMALFGSAVYQYEEFRTITGTLQHTIPPTNLVAEPRVFQQNHKMLYEKSPYYYEICTGGKTGFTDQALTTLVTFADNGDMHLVAVNLKSHGVNVYTDTRAMFDYAYANFHKTSIAEQNISEDIDTVEEGAYVVLPDQVSFSDLDVDIEVTDKEHKTGVITYSYEGQKVGSADITLKASYFEKAETVVKKTEEKDKKQPAKEKTVKEEKPSRLVKCLIAVTTIVMAGVVILYVAAKHKMKKRRRRRHCNQRKRD